MGDVGLRMSNVSNMQHLTIQASFCETAVISYQANSIIKSGMGSGSIIFIRKELSSRLDIQLIWTSN